MAKAFLTEYFDANVYSREHVISTLKKYGIKICPSEFIALTSNSDMITITEKHNVNRNISVEDYADYEISNSRLINFYWNQYQLMPHPDEYFAAFPMVIKSHEIECPKNLLPVIFEAATTGGPVLVRNSADSQTATMIEKTTSKFLKPYVIGSDLVMPSSMNHLATKISVSGYDYWLKANSFFTKCMRIKRMLPNKQEMMHHVSCSGWITEDLTNVAD